MQLSARMQKASKSASLRPLREAGKMRLGAPKKQWVIHPPDDRSARLAKSLKVSPLLAQVLINRGISDARDAGIFLRPKLNTVHLHMFRYTCLNVGVGGGIRQRGYGNAAWKAGRACADLIQGKGSDS